MEERLSPYSRIEIAKLLAQYVAVTKCRVKANDRIRSAGEGKAIILPGTNTAVT